jgi:uncharacterized protein (TIGR02118 family)
VETLVIGLWRATGTTAAECRAALHDDWAPAALGVDGLLALTLNSRLSDQGVHTHEPDERGDVANADALIRLGLERAHDLDDVPVRDGLHALARRIDVWRVQTHVRLDSPVVPGAAPDGGVPEVVPEVVMVSFVTRLESLSHEQFVRHWTERHTPLALRHHIGMCGYRQHVVRRAYTPGGRSIDGIAELVFATRDDFDQRYYDSDAGKRVIREDVARFIQPGPTRLTTLMDTTTFRTETR